MKVSNVSQTVDNNKYSSEFERIFGSEKPVDATGVYKYDENRKEMFKIADNPFNKVTSDRMSSIAENIRKINPVILKRRNANVDGTACSIDK